MYQCKHTCVSQAWSIGWSCEGRLATGTMGGWVVLADVDSHGNARYVQRVCVPISPSLSLLMSPKYQERAYTCDSAKESFCILREKRTRNPQGMFFCSSCPRYWRLLKSGI